jgi:hypothetical protein
MKLSVQSGEIVLDPMNGSSLSREELEERWNPSWPISPKKISVTNCRWRPICARPSARDPGAHAAQPQGHLHGKPALATGAGCAGAPGDPAARGITEKRDRGLAFANLGLAQAALEDLEAYLALRPHAEDAPNLREMLPDLREALRKPN